ncbi:MAG: hypothetical protein EBV06_07585 [Planctomycetia bacterium]|nr:hypothetical protein [Planctomycetia bacterium]
MYKPCLQGWFRRRGIQHRLADDLVGETLTTLTMELPNFPHNGNTSEFRSWMRGTLVNRLRNFRRAQRV